MSARRIGEYTGGSAQDVNKQLAEAGLLEGEPGAYSITEAGEAYGQDHDHDNGYGGYAHRSWSTRTWDPGVIAEITEWDPLAVDWYCDDCNAYMNTQVGFESVGSSWVCTNCGCINDTTASNLR